MPRTDMRDRNIAYHSYFDILKDKHDRRVLRQSNLALGINCGAGDCQVTLNELSRSGGGYDQFLSILDEQRRKKKMTENELKQTFKPEIGNVKERVGDLVDKLKTQFSYTKQARKRHITKDGDYAKYVWNNSVDSFLRYHEKLKIDIKYHGDGDHPGEGFYTFAVRPDRIRKRFTEAKPDIFTEPCEIRIANKDTDSDAKMTNNTFETNAYMPIHQEPLFERDPGIATLDDLIADNNLAKYSTKHESVYDVTENEYDDSPFGILSVYCSSGLHSGYDPGEQCSGL